VTKFPVRSFSPPRRKTRALIQQSQVNLLAGSVKNTQANMADQSDAMKQFTELQVRPSLASPSPQAPPLASPASLA